MEELLLRRLSYLSKEDIELLRSFAAYYFYLEEAQRSINYDILDRLKEALELKASRLYEILVGSGLIIIHGYKSIVSRDKVVEHLGVYVLPWSHGYLKKKFSEYLAVQEDRAREIIRKLEEMKECTICGKIIAKGEKYTSLYGFKLHLNCYETWKRRIGQILSSLPKIISEEERELVAEFYALGAIKGEYLYEQTIPLGRNLHPYIGERRIDLVIRTEDVDWIIEAEGELNYQAIGQALAYSILWSIAHPGRQVLKAALVGTAPEDLMRVARILGIKVFSRI